MRRTQKNRRIFLLLIVGLILTPFISPFLILAGLAYVLIKSVDRIEDTITQQYRKTPTRKRVWKRETIIYEIVKEIYPNYTVKFHHRPGWLKGLELDVFIEELNIGIEHQGEQHFRPVKDFGGYRTFKRVKRNDKLKKEICDQHGVPIVYFGYKEKITGYMVERRIEYCLQQNKKSVYR